MRKETLRRLVALILFAALLSGGCSSGTVTPAPTTPTITPPNASGPVLVVSDKARLTAVLGVTPEQYKEIEDKAKEIGEVHYFDEEYIAKLSDAEKTELLKLQAEYLDAATKGTDDALIRSSRETYVQRVDGWLEGLLAGKSYYAVLILGGDGVIPYAMVDNPAYDPNPNRDNDLWLPTDDIYGDTTHDAERLIDLPVARLPDGKSLDLLKTQLSIRSPATSGHYGLGNVARPGADAVADVYGGKADFLWSEPTENAVVTSPSQYSYFILHGSRTNGSNWVGEYTGKGGNPVALRASEAKSTGIVLSSACYGAYTIGRLPDASVALSFLKNGTWAFVGSTMSTYSNVIQGKPEEYVKADEGRFSKLFFEYLVKGEAPMSAFYYTKLEYARGATTASERKHVHEYVFYGLPKYPGQVLVTPTPPTPAPITPVTPPITYPGVTPVPPGGPASTATVFLLDVSGSMAGTWQGGVKIESARQAALQVLDMIERDSQTGGVTHQVAVASFSNDAIVDLPLTTDYTQARQALQSLIPLSNTNVGAGIQRSNELLLGAGNAKKIIILLSDGQTNTGLGSAEILSGPVQEAARAGACIYTVGFGDPGDIDEFLLQQIAQTACGKYAYASTPYELDKVYVEVRHTSTGNLIAQWDGTVSQGATTMGEPVTVPVGQGEMHVTLNWPGSRLGMILTDPAGRTVDATYPGATVTNYARMVYLIITSPTAGVWQAAVRGLEVPEGTIDYTAMFSVRPAVKVPGSALPIVILAGLLLVILGVVLALSGRRGGAAAPAAGLAFAGQSAAAATFRRNVLHIGRDPRCEMVLSDPLVTRVHARIVATPSGYQIEDLNSKNGTFVNGQRVSRQTLRAMDRIKVGDTELVFWVQPRR